MTVATSDFGSPPGPTAAGVDVFYRPDAGQLADRPRRHRAPDAADVVGEALRGSPDLRRVDLGRYRPEPGEVPRREKRHDGPEQQQRQRRRRGLVTEHQHGRGEQVPHVGTLATDDIAHHVSPDFDDRG